MVMGRPIKGEQARDKRVNLRFTANEFKELQELSAITEQTYTETILQALALLREKVSERDPG